MKKVNIFHNTVLGGFQWNDIEYLSRNFDAVNLFCIKIDENKKLPSNVNVHVFSDKPVPIGFSQRIKLLFVALKDLFTKGSSLAYFKKFRFNYAFLSNAFKRSMEIEQTIRNNDTQEIYISYWWDNSALALYFLKKRGKINRFYCRAHGRDLFEHREPQTKKLPFRLEVLKEVEKIYSVSICGLDYLQKRFPDYKNKLASNCLGSRDYGFSEKELNPEFTIATVCRVRNIKRVFLLAEALAVFDIPTKWIHIGGKANAKRDYSMERYYSSIEALEANEKITFVDEDDLSQEEVLETLIKNKVELLVSVSETEGLPVSIMEAFSAGIPVLATDVGGCSELVNDITGKLLTANPDLEEIRNGLIHFYDNRMEYNKLQNTIRENWEEKYDIAKNYRVFCKTLTEHD